MKVSVITPNGTWFEVECKPSDKVADVKRTIENTQGSDTFPAIHQILVYDGKILEDGSKISDVYEYSVKNNLVLLYQRPLKPEGIASLTTSTTEAESVVDGDEEPRPLQIKDEMEPAEKMIEVTTPITIKPFYTTVQPESTVWDVKQSIEDQVSIPAVHQRMLYNQTILRNASNFLEQHGQTNDSTLVVFSVLGPDVDGDQAARAGADGNEADEDRDEIINLLLGIGQGLWDPDIVNIALEIAHGDWGVAVKYLNIYHPTEMSRQLVTAEYMPLIQQRVFIEENEIRIAEPVGPQPEVTRGDGAAVLHLQIANSSPWKPAIETYFACDKYVDLASVILRRHVHVTATLLSWMIIFSQAMAITLVLIFLNLFLKYFCILKTVS